MLGFKSLSILLASNTLRCIILLRMKNCLLYFMVHSTWHSTVFDSTCTYILLYILLCILLGFYYAFYLHYPAVFSVICCSSTSFLPSFYCALYVFTVRTPIPARLLSEGLQACPNDSAGGSYHHCLPAGELVLRGHSEGLPGPQVQVQGTSEGKKICV